MGATAGEPLRPRGCPRPVPVSSRAAAVLAAVLVAFACLPTVATALAAQATATNGAISFSANRAGSRAIYTREPDGGRLRLVPTSGRAEHPAFSPGGKRLALTRYGPWGAQIWTQYLDGSAERPLTQGSADTSATWSPDETSVAFARGRAGRRDIWRVVADGTGLARMTRDARDDSAPNWSVANRLAFVRRNLRGSDIYTIGPGGGPARRLTHSRQDDVAPAWSPTGRTLVYSKGNAGQRDLYLLTANGRRSRRLTGAPGDEGAPAFSPDGSRIAFTHRRAGQRRVYTLDITGPPIRKLPSASGRVRRLTTAGSASNAANWQPESVSPVVAAAGDIACDPAHRAFAGGAGLRGDCRQLLTSNLLLRMDLASVLAVGDTQYETGQLEAFQRSFDLSWGRLKTLIRPVPGNHEYAQPGATGYFDYFNGPGQRFGPAGDRVGGGYYSYEIGGWHVVALNSQCAEVPGGCSADSPQNQWLRADLAAHPAACTLAYFHGPRFTSGRHGNQSENVRPFWDTLYAAGADLVLSGHEHFYERFAPQTPDGVPDPARGIRQITVGVGGRAGHPFYAVAPNSEVRLTGTLGVVALTLGEGSYEFNLMRASSGRSADSGSGRCH